ncbi:hypothetical protein EV175_001653 [Coemansia sp. RSA 1933]|nr:hypothetical protein EV175_001653 [Coemansia sp. RSA 1933]
MPTTAVFPPSPADEPMSPDNLNHLEKRVGHLTLDPTGSLRYLGDSSGWYIINHNLVSLETSSRLKKGPSGAFRWPPITTIATRESDSADVPAVVSAVSAAANTQATTVPASATSGPSLQKPDPASDDIPADAKKGTRSAGAASSSCVVAVPRNVPPCAKPPMPSVDEQINLLSLYFRYVHPVFPILSKSHLLQRAFDRERPLAPAFMSAVFAAASTYKAREAKSKDDLARVRIQMAVHFQRAKLYLDEQYTNNSLSSILTLLLMSVYEQGTMSTRSWLYSGMAIRKAYDMGLHRDMGVAKHNEINVVSKRETDIRLRAWWGCYIMDIMVSATLGRPTTIRDFTFDAPFPNNYGDDDDELLVDSSLNESHTGGNADPAQPRESLEQIIRQRAQPLQSQRQPGSSKGASGNPNPRGIPPVAESMRDYVALTIGDPESDMSDTEPDNARGEGQNSPREKPHGVYYLELLHIFGHVLTEMYTCKPNRDFSIKYCFYGLRSRTERLIALDHELRQWMDSLPPELRYPVDDILAARPARCVYIALIHLVYYTAMILLHRPFISRLGSSQQSTPSRTIPASMDRDQRTASSDHLSGADSSADGCAHLPRSDKSSPLPSHSICTVSAQMISLIGQAIIQDSRIFIMPFLTFMMFTAGTMHLNNVIVAADSWIARRFLKRTLNVMSRLGAHWQVSYKCYTMLNTLVRANRIGLDQLVDDDKTGIRVIKERYRENIHLSQLVYEDRFSHRTWSSPDPHQDPTHSPASPIRPSTPSHMQGHSDKPCAIVETDRDTGTAKSRSTGDNPSMLRQHTTQTSGSRSFERMHVSGDRSSEENIDPSELSKGSAVASPSDAQSMDCSGDFAAANDGMNPVTVGSSGSDGNIYSSHLQYQIPPSDGISTNSYSFNRQRHQQQQQPTDSRVPMFLRIPALRRVADANGHPIVPASPYTSVTLSGGPEMSSEPAAMTGPPESDMPTSAYVAASQGMQNMSESTMSLGRFVPSLEFFANAEFPLGIGGPNGQASLVLPQAMAAAHKTGSNSLGQMPGYSQSDGQLAGLRLATRVAEKRPALDGLSLADPSLRSRPVLPVSNTGSGNGAAFVNSATLGTALPTFSDAYRNDPPNTDTPASTSFVTASQADISNATDLSSLGRSRSGGGFVFENGVDSSNNATPANMGFSGMLIDDNVIRNLPFSGPVSYDLGIGGIENLSSMLFRGVDGETGTGGSPGVGIRQEFGSATPLQPTAASGSATGNKSSEMPWNDYLDQVIRMFNNNNNNNNNGSM